jgi:hypothetical protein
MEHVGWRDVSSALRYVDVSQEALKSKFERGLATSAQQASQPLEEMVVNHMVATIHLRMLLSKPGGSQRGAERVRKQIEMVQLAKFGVRQIDRDAKRFELQVPFQDRDNLDDTLLELLDELYRVALASQCLLEASLHEPATDSTWN